MIMPEDKITIVTGASGGLGSAVAAALPGRVTATDIRAADGVVVLDSCDENAVREFFAAMQARGEKVHGLVNVAGKPGERNLEDMDLAFWDDVLRANVASAMIMTRFASPLMSEGSAVVNFSSVAGFRGFAGRAAYCAAKSAVIGMTRALSVELAPRGIRVNAVAPGSIESPWISRLIDGAQDAQEARRMHEQRAPLNRLGHPREIAALVRFLLSEDSGFTTGATYSADGGALVS